MFDDHALCLLSQLPGEEEEELSGRSAVVESVLADEADLELGLLQVFLGCRHDADVGVFEQVLAPDGHFEATGTLAVAFRLQLPVKVAQFILEIALTRPEGQSDGSRDGRRRVMRRRDGGSAGCVHVD